MTWQTFRDAVVTAVESAMPAATLETCSVSWTDGPRPYAPHRVLLDVVSFVPIHDRDSSLTTGGAQELSTAARVTLQVTFESSYDSADLDALWLIEQVRLGLRRVSVAEALHAAEIRIVGFPGPTTKRSYNADDRVISAHSFDVTLAYVFTIDASDENAGLIETVEEAGTYTDPAGGDTVLSFSETDPTPEP